MSPTSNLAPVAAAGRSTGLAYKLMLQGPDHPNGAFSFLIGSLNANVGQGGTFDYQRQGNSLSGYEQFPQFRDVSNFNVGLFSQQAGLSLDETLSIAGSYASLFSSNAAADQRYGLSERTYDFIVQGYNVGQSGVYGKPGG